MRVHLDGQDVASGATGGVDLRRLCGGAGGFGRVNWGLGVSLSRVLPWPASGAGMLCTSGWGDCHGLSALLGGGARGGCPGSKVSMIIMAPPQCGQGWARAGGSVSSAVWVSSASGVGMPSSSRARAMLRVPMRRLAWSSRKTSHNSLPKSRRCHGRMQKLECPLLMQWTAPTRRHLGAKMVVYMNHREIGAVL